MASGLPLTDYYSMPYLASFFDIMSNVQRLMHSMPAFNYPTSAYDISCVIEQTFMHSWKWYRFWNQNNNFIDVMIPKTGPFQKYQRKFV